MSYKTGSCSTMLLRFDTTNNNAVIKIVINVEMGNVRSLLTLFVVYTLNKNTDKCIIALSMQP